MMQSVRRWLFNGFGQAQEQDLGQAPARVRYGLRPHHIVHNFPLMLGLIVSVTLFVIMVFGPLWVSQDPYLSSITVLPHFDVEIMKFIRPPFDPSAEYLLGSDPFGNDVLSLLVFGARVTLVSAAYITLGRLILGTVLGSVAGWYSGRLPDRLLMGAIAVITSLPALLAALILLVAVGPEKGLAVFLPVLTLVGWTEAAQYARSEIMVIRQRGYIESAEAAGGTDLEIVVRHVWPNLAPHLLALTFLEMGSVLILIAELGFLGVFMGGDSRLQLDLGLFGSPPPVYVLPEMPEWGAQVAQGVPYVRSAPHLLLAPGAAFLITIMGLNALGEGLRRLLDYTSVSTAFLLRRRMLLVLVLFVAGTVLLLQYTGPERSYARLANSIDGEAAYAQAQRLAQAGGGAANYLAQRLEAYDFEPGYADEGFGKTFTHTFEVQEVTTTVEPLLAIVDEGWRPTQAFSHGEGFGFALDGEAGGGEVVGPVTLVHFRADDPVALGLAFEGVELSERIVLLSNAPDEFVDVALRRGARGVMVLSETVASQRTLSESQGRGPVFRVRRNVAREIVAAGGGDLDRLLAGTEENATRVYGDLGVTVHMALHLGQPQMREVPAVFAFLPGYDQTRASEIVLLMGTFDSRGESGGGVEAQLGAGVLLEVARAWQAHGVDPRRSLMLVAWGGQAHGMVDYLDNLRSFSQLVAQVPSATLRPAAALHYEAGPGRDVWMPPSQHEELAQVVQTALAQVGADGQGSGADDQQPPVVQSPLDITHPRYVYLHWGMGEAEGADDAEALERLGRALTHSLVRLVREDPW
ncbi:MAG: ABC transporter permease subunit [bacterium]